MSFPSYEPGAADPGDAYGPAGAPELAPEPFAGVPTNPELPPGFSPAEMEETLDLKVPLTDEEWRTLGQRFAREFFYFEDAFATRRDNAQDWRDDATVMPDSPVLDWRDAVVQTQDYAWMAKCRSFLTATAIDGTVQKLAQQILMPHPPFIAVPEEPTMDLNGIPIDLVQRAPDVQEAWQSLLEAAGWAESCRELFREIATACPAARKVSWCKKSIWVAERTLRQDEELMFALLEDGSTPPDEALIESVETDAMGRPRVKAKFVEKVVYEGARFTVIPMEDLIWFPATARHVDDTFAIGERIRVRGCDLMEKLKDKRSGYRREACEWLLAQPSDAPTQTEQMRQDRIAMSVTGAPTDDDLPEHREWQCVELAYRGRLGGEKMDKWYWVTFHPPTGTLIRCCYILDRHGECPYTIYNLKGERLVGMSVAEVNAVYQSAYTTLLNSALDLVSIMIGCSGSFLTTPGSGLKPNTFTIAPGRQIMVNDLNAIKHLEIPDNIPMAMREIREMLGLLRENSQTLTSTSNISLGKEAQGDKTATEIEMVFGQDQAISEQLGYGVALQCAKDLDKFRQLEAQYAKDSLRNYVAQGAEGAEHKAIEAELLAAPYKILPAGLTASSSAQARVQKAMMVLQTVMTNPILAVPENIFDALESYLQSLGQGNYALYIRRAKEALIMQQQAAAEDAAIQDQAAQEKGAILASEVEKTEAERKGQKPGKDGKMPPPPPGPGVMDAVSAMSNGGPPK